MLFKNSIASGCIIPVTLPIGWQYPDRWIYLHFSLQYRKLCKRVALSTLGIQQSTSQTLPTTHAWLVLFFFFLRMFSDLQAAVLVSPGNSKHPQDSPADLRIASSVDFITAVKPKLSEWAFFFFFFFYL